MKITIAIILSLLPLPAIAQTYDNPATSPTIYMPPPPVSYQTFGTVTYGSDGSTASTYGNQTYIQSANPVQPQVVCSTYGNITSCQ